jgi:hypothetical protein
MKGSHDTMRGLAALLAAPALVLGLRIAAGLGPERAAARDARHAPPELHPAPASPRALTASEYAALAWLETVDMNAPIACPIQTGQTIVEAPLVEAAAPSVLGSPPEPGLPALRLTSVLATRDGEFASINGRVLRIGDTVAPGWTLTAIDAPAGLVIITRYDGAIRRLSQPR